MAEKKTASSQEDYAAFTHINKKLVKLIEYLAPKNGRIIGMNYFYNSVMGLYTDRAREIEELRAKGKKIVGVFCNFVPEELIYASGAIPIRLSAGLQDTILTSEEILPRNFCPLIKSALGFALQKSPHFESTDVVIVPTTCDGKKKLPEILGEMKPTWTIEVPHTMETPQARELWLTELGLLKDHLEKLTGNKIKKKALKREILLANRKRAALRKLYELRKRTPPPIWGRDALLITNQSYHDDSLRWTKNVERLCHELKEKGPVSDKSYPRILLTGCPTVLPTWKIPLLLEESGGIIVCDDICTGSKGLWDPVEIPNWTLGEMLIGLADRYLMNTCACFTPNMARIDRLFRFIEEYNIEGVIYYTLMACHIYGMEIHRIENALKSKNIPVLKIETDYSEEDVEQIRTRMEAFIEMIMAKKGVRLRGTDVRRPEGMSSATTRKKKRGPPGPPRAASAASSEIDGIPALKGPPGPPATACPPSQVASSSISPETHLRDRKLAPPCERTALPTDDQKRQAPGKKPSGRLRDRKLTPPGQSNG